MAFSLTNLLKQWLKAAPFPLLIRGYFLYYLCRYLPKYEDCRRRGSFARLGDLDLEKLKKSDVLFIMGSGPSINRITPERWKGIERGDSIGFNLWLYHPFVPSMYFFESTSPYSPPGWSKPDEVYNRVVSCLLGAMEARAEDYRDVPKVVMDLVQKIEDQYVFHVPTGWRTNLYAAYTVPLIARDAAEFRYGLSYLVGKGIFRRRPRTSFLFKHCASISSLVSLGAIMGYRKIVLCGIDMTETSHFYNDPELFPATRDLYFDPPEGAHLALQAYAWGNTPIDVVLLELKRQVLDPAGIELYVENPGSALCPRIPAAPDSVFEIPAAAGPAARVL